MIRRFWSRGDRLTAAQVGEIADAADRYSRLKVRKPLYIDKRPSGDVLGIRESVERKPGKGETVTVGGGLFACKLHLVLDDALRVFPWDEETRTFSIAGAFHIAKPWDLQKTPWNGQVWGGVLYNYRFIDSQSREASGAGFTEEVQRVIPRYIGGTVNTGQVLYWTATDYTNVTDPDDATKKLGRIDANLAGRAWAWIGTI